MDKRDSELIIKLAREGKPISKIFEEDFPEYNYWDIYFTVNDAGEKSSVGVKRMITNRLYKITSLPKKEQENVIREIDELVCFIYDRYKESQQKLDDIRNIMDR
ncbi:MAG: hypothetical protein PUE01_03490 [Clostridiaceae bacterium]|nr:hypothetical protein [Clostridiaceae bacterium]